MNNSTNKRQTLSQRLYDICEGINNHKVNEDYSIDDTKIAKRDIPNKVKDAIDKSTSSTQYMLVNTKYIVITDDEKRMNDIQNLLKDRIN